MRRNRRGGHGGMEFGGSGEDSFVAVVVTKLTGALLFILLLTMVIMALLPKAVDLPASDGSHKPEPSDLTIATPGMLPEAIAGHPYALALAAEGGKGPLKWSVAGELPEGLSLEPETGILRGTAVKGTPKPVELTLRVSDSTTTATQTTQLLVYQSDKPLTTPAWWKPGIPPIPWQAWLEQGFGFLILALIHMVGMNSVASLERWAVGAMEDGGTAEERLAASRRFMIYRTLVRLASGSALLFLAVWLSRKHA